MKAIHTTLIAILLTLSVADFPLAQAARVTPAQKIEAMVLRDINAVMSDTYNEGEGTATAKRAACRIVKSTALYYTAFCSVDILVQPSRDSEYVTTTTCTSMKYHASPSLQSVELVDGWEACIESVNDITEF